MYLLISLRKYHIKVALEITAKRLSKRSVAFFNASLKEEQDDEITQNSEI
jgi:hypothetical protein